MINEDRDSTAKNYKAAVSSIHKFFRSNKVMFSQFTSLNIDKWIKSLSSMKRAKEMYPVCIRMIYKSAVREYNDYDNGIIRIKVNPWVKVDIPKGDTPEKRAITADECRAFFAADCKDNGYINSRFELGHDVAMLVFCLAGINTADLYRLKKSNYHNGIICYNRSKTLKYRSDNAYFEIKAERIILPIIDKYLAGKDDPFLFVFHKLYANLDSFNSAVNSGIGKICDSIGIPNQLRYSVYTFRHTWATIAQNDCGASIPEVGFAMNHSQRSTRITKSYIKIDFSPAWRLNAKVIEFIFFSSKKGKLAESTSEKKEDKIFRISMKAMIYGCAYFCGNLLAEVSDVGYNNIDDVIKKLAQKLPKRLPNMSKIQVRIKNVDNDTEVVYEKTKGKDF
jgi:integrase